MPTSGGPTLEFCGGGILEDGGTKFIRQGSLSYNSIFWIDKEAYYPPVALIKTYKSLVGNLKKSSLRVKHGKMVFWVGAEAVKAIRLGAKLQAFKEMSSDELLIGAPSPRSQNA